MNYRLITCALALIIVGSIGVSCVQSSSQSPATDPWGVVTVPKGEPIRIAVAVSKSDPVFAPLGVEQARGAAVAVHEFGAILGFSVVVEDSDPQCSTSGGASSASAIASDHTIVGVVGMTCSSSCTAAAPFFENSHLTSISPSCGASALTSPVGHQGSFLTTSYPASLEGTVGGEFAFNSLGARTAAVISYDGIETLDTVNAFTTSFETLGGTISSTATVVAGQSSYGPTIQSVMSANPDVLYVPLLPFDAANFVAQMKSSKFARTTILGGRYYWSNGFINKLGTLAEGIYAIGPYTNGPDYDSVTKFYSNIYGLQPSGGEHAFAFDSTSLLLQAISKIAVLDSQGNLLIGLKALRDAALHTSDYHGATGNITCTAWGDCGPHGAIAVSQVKASQWIIMFIR